ncbi:pyridoxamine 5'-phosphate oxidase family protein [Candidatus Micrarchaeota archaeon]|nr:pyridoxamine 5'-phosphate oxidase family protein [Candidatus Micrarchaeota archaeon]
MAGWKDCFQEKKEIVLVTCSKKSVPNANVVVSLGFVDNKLLIADCMMKTTLKNLEENPKVCVIGGYYRIVGDAEVLQSGKYFDIAAKILSNQDKTLKLKNAISISVKGVFDLEKSQKIL